MCRCALVSFPVSLWAALYCDQGSIAFQQQNLMPIGSASLRIHLLALKDELFLPADMLVVMGSLVLVLFNNT